MALVVAAVRGLLGLFFMLMGGMKLTDRISPQLYAKAVDEFEKFADVFPLNDVGIKLDPMQYLLVVGWIELIGGLVLAFGTKILQEISSIILSIIMMGAIYSQLVLKKPLYMCIPASVCLGLLLLLFVWGRDKEKQKEE
ncbi:transmembrane protein 35B-like isoform X2 [Cetorhinus maximus]